jgi:DNA polymerase-3 subunit gamma/tau
VSYQVFARKYRPRTFEDVLGQDHVVRTLRNAIAQGRLAHAYLFVGPRGTGKTSTARIFAKALNNPSGPSVDFDPNDPDLIEIAEGRSLDVLEIDGASNNGVEQVRQLRETVQYAPAKCSFKIYYIDEVHMLSNAAFNALLKTLEEPPPHVKFIFATTEPNKILPTIISRCQRFDLRPIPTPIIAKQLLHIAKEENVAIDEPAAWAIAKGAEGGMRDAQSMLDQLVAFCGETIQESDVQQIFGFTAGETIAALITRLLKKETGELLNELDELATSGKNLSQLLQELIGTLRALLIHKVDPKSDREGLSEEVWQSLTALTKDLDGERLLALIDTLSSAEAGMRWATNKQLHLELALIKSAQTLDEIRISDVITALVKGGYSDENPPTLSPPSQTPSPEENIETKAPPAPELEATEPETEPAPPSEEKPQTKPPAAKKDGLSTIERLMQDAPDHREEEDDPPAPPKTNASSEKEEKPKAETSPPDDFHNDPLIQDALEIFKGKLKK